MEQETWGPSSFSDDYEVSNLGRVRQKNSELVLEDVRINEFLLDAFLKKPDNIEDSPMNKKHKKATKTKKNPNPYPVDVTVRGEAPQRFDSLDEAAKHLGIPVASMHRNNDKGFVNGISIVSSMASEIGPRPKPKSIKLEVTARGKEPLRFDSPKEAATHLGKSVATIYKNIDKGFVDRISIVKAKSTNDKGFGNVATVKEEPKVKEEAGAFVGLVKKRKRS